MDIKTIKTGVTNSYLFANKEKYVLVDTCYAGKWETFCSGLGKNGIPIGMISHVILTHHHDDHCGLLNKLIEVNKNIRVVMAQKAKDALSGGKNLVDDKACWLNKRVDFLIGMISKIDSGMTGNFPPYETRDKDILLNKDTDLSDIGIDARGRIIETKGHTKDSISIIFEDGDIISGDAAANFFAFAGTKNCCIFINDLDEYYYSWDRMIDSGARKIYPGHGKPFSIDRLIKNNRKNKKENLVRIQS